MKKKRLLSFTVHVLWVISLIFFLFPLFWVLSLSFKPALLAFRYPPAWWFMPTMEHYIEALQDEYLQSLKNSFVVAGGTITLSLLVGLPAAYSIARRKVFFGPFLFRWTFLTRMVPAMTFLIPFYMAYRTLGLLDTHIGLMIIYMIFNLALVIGSMSVFFAGVPKEIEESAYMDGASINQTFLKITLPLVTPGLIATAILCFLYSWNQFLWPLVLTRSSARTAPVVIMNFLRYEEWDWGGLAAGIVLLVIPVIAFSALIKEYLVKGIAAGAVKG